MVDMRKRFRGNQPATLQKIQKTEEAGDGYQLYAGKSAFAGSRGETHGNNQAPKDWRELENEKYRKETAGNGTTKS